MSIISSASREPPTSTDDGRSQTNTESEATTSILAPTGSNPIPLDQASKLTKSTLCNLLASYQKRSEESYDQLVKEQERLRSERERFETIDKRAAELAAEVRELQVYRQWFISEKGKGPAAEAAEAGSSRPEGVSRGAPGISASPTGVNRVTLGTPAVDQSEAQPDAREDVEGVVVSPATVTKLDEKRAGREGSEKVSPRRSPGPPDSPDPSDPGSPNSLGGYGPRGNRRVKRSPGHTGPAFPSDDEESLVSEDAEINWSRFYFKPEKEHFLKGTENWENYRAMIKVALACANIHEHTSLTTDDELMITSAILRTVKPGPLALVQRMTKGTEILEKFSRIYGQSGASRKASTLKELINWKYDGKDPIGFLTQWERRLNDYIASSTTQLQEEDKISWFLNSTEKARFWHQSMITTLRHQKLPLTYVAEDFIAAQKTYAQNKGNVNNAQRSRGRGRGRGRSIERLPRKDKDGRPLCFKCKEYGHIAKDCPEESARGNSQNAGQSSQGVQTTSRSTPQGLEGTERGPIVYQMQSARATNPEEFKDLVQYYESAIKRIESACPGDLTPTERSPEARPQEGAIRYIFAGRTPESERLLWDSGADVDVTNSMSDFVKGTVVDITERNYKINTGGGPVIATRMGTLHWKLLNKDKVTDIQVKFGLLIPGFPLKIISGVHWYKGGGRLQGTSLTFQGKEVAQIDIETREFFLLYRK
jgi:hypothetical protein